ncbi:MAG: RnfABCDGE type electron transport complex subunit D [Clostridia bacterium]|nr:RnfABCDGE type electron transport complex subunit D [Clostridia bacterium]
MQNILTASASPHKKTSQTTKRIMADVFIALLPAAVMGCVYFGYQAIIVLVLSLAACVATEFVWQFACRVKWKDMLKQFDGTSLVTGLLLAMCFNSSTPWYVVILSAVFAIGVVKMLFGGTGKNVVNPAIAGRVFALIAFQRVMTAGYVLPNFTPESIASVTTGATPLTGLLNGETAGMPLLWQMFLGVGMSGTIGETCKLALVAGYIYLVVRRVLDWKWPLITIIVCGLTHVALNGFDFGVFLPYTLSGGLFLGAIFMPTDYVTSPKTQLGCIVYYIILGAVIAVLRQATQMEVVSFAILLMNLVVPLIDRFIRPRPFGYVKPEKKKADKKEATK